MTSLWSRFAKTLRGIVLGEIALILLTTLAQEVIYNGISYNTSPTLDLLSGGLLTVLAAILAGIIAAYAGGKGNYWPHVFISIIISIEMTYLISSGITKDPLWFDVLAGLSLVTGVWIGFLAVRNLKSWG
ncbi:MAG: hypothetical protein RIF39_04950 [Cyclobacteriaceae bacterium]